ncbi:hypothetical protein BLS_003200 [Venturia inaequalis]|uniref:Cell division control protein 73 C-terminal domain-containing protein n=1 Tax=Venturia inaequalis TaxID=5025 RepID=A0A8H3VBQ4_VENIN|nr:hypothetical protein BLS_003200 [Venturia inaequalis]
MSLEAVQNDPLLNLQQAIAANQEPILTSTPDPAVASDAEPDLAKATYIHFNTPEGSKTYPLKQATRFILPATGKEVDLRSVYFAWTNREKTVPDYLNAGKEFNNGLAAPGGAGGRLENLGFSERKQLESWLDGSSAGEENDYIKPLEAEKAAAAARGSAAVASGAAGGIPTIKGAGIAAAPVKGLRSQDPRLAEIYRGERPMGDRNTILRGIKPTDFSHVRKQCDIYLGRNRSRHAAVPTPMTSNSSLVSNLKKPSARRLEPIILLSPSASSLLRMSNIKQFLDLGMFAPADSGSTATILHIQRTMPTIDSRPLRFILVDSADQFKPDYWQRVVAVFTTGQTWQFKSYKWQTPQELFAHALGIYIGWHGEPIPAAVLGWGRSVKTAQIDHWSQGQGEKGRWRDREIVEGLWTAIEESMRAKGWGKEGFGG